MHVCEWLMGGDDGFEPPTLFYAKCPSYLHQSYAAPNGLRIDAFQPAPIKIHIGDS